MEIQEYNQDCTNTEASPFTQVLACGETTQRNLCIPFLSKEEVDNISSEETFEYGEWPQDTTDSLLSMELEHAFHEYCKIKHGSGYQTQGGSQMTETGKEYSALAPKTKLKKFKEYEYEGKKYVRVVPTASVPELGIEENRACWFAVQPITWFRIDDGQAIAPHYSLVPGRCCDEAHPHYVDESEWKSKFQEWFERRFSKEFLHWGMVAVDAQEIVAPKRKRRGYGVTIKEEPMSIKEQIDFYIENGKTFMLVGPSGCGKTQRIMDIDPNFIAIPLAKGCDTQDIVGKVVFETEKDHSSVDEKDEFIALPKGGKWYAPAWYKDICEICKKEPDKKHVLFIDEFLNVSEHQQALLLHLLGEHRSITANAGVLPDNAVIALAGNRTTESGAAYNPTETAWRRCAAIIEIQPNVAEWLKWGSQKSASHPNEEGRLNVHPLVAAFVAAYGKDCFYKTYNEDEPERVMDPRGWEQVSDIIYDNEGVIAYELLYNKMGEDLAKNFFAFAKDPPITAEEILSGDIEGVKLPQKPDEKLALIYSLRAVSDRQVCKVRNFVHRYLGAESKSVFDQVWCDGNPKRALFLANLDKQQSGDLGR